MYVEGGREGRRRRGEGDLRPIDIQDFWELRVVVRSTTHGCSQCKLLSSLKREGAATFGRVK